MEELDFRELLDYYKEKILLITLITFGFCLIGSIYSLFLQKPEYTSSTTLVLTGLSSESSTITTNDLSINSQLVSTYREIVKSRKVLTQVADEVGTTMEDLTNKISVSSVSGTEIIKIYVTDSEPEMATNIANSVASVFSTEISKMYNIKNISILDEANTPISPSNINVPKQIILFFLVGFVIAMAFTFVLFYFDTSIKSVEQIEKKIMLPILGSVPDYNSKKRGKK